MSKRKGVLLIIVFIGIGFFGYSQYAAASQIGVSVTQNEFLERNDKGSFYKIQLEFTNPSFLILNAGETNFKIIIEDIKVADGVLEPFILPSMSKVNVNGNYFEEDNSAVQKGQSSQVSISGITKYDVFFTSIEVPFIYIPSEDQAREFIHQK